MGLERTAAIMQGVHSNYEIDLFRHLIRAAGHFAGITDEAELSASASLRVIADHIRSSAFLIADGVMPGNEDRAYVLRRIIRRGLRHGHKLNITQPFFHKLVPALVDEMGVAYPELAERQSQVTDVLRGEEERFSETLSQGMDLLRGRIDALQGDTIPGEVVFQLYDTYGFPADLTADIARERNLQVDMAGFDAAMEAQRARGRAAATFSASLGQRVNVAEPVEFRGYDGVDASGSVLALFDLNGDPLERLESGTEGVVVLDRTAFYAESGGQVGDQGVLRAGEVQFDVTDTKLSGVQHMHIGKLISGTVAAGMSLETQVDNERRARVRRNHSATHLLHAALRRTLGSHVQQKGSLVNDEKLRFDFSHPEPLTAEQLRDIDDLVNRVILANSEVQTEVMDYDAAVKRGAIALFGEKYGDEVRVLTMGDGYSVELCGGTHVSRTGDIGLFNIVGETGIASGVRRVEAITGAAAVAAVRDTQNIVERAARLLKSNPQQLEERVAAMAEENRSLHKSLGELNQRLAQGKGMDFAAQAKDINGVKLLTAKIDGDTSAMMNTLDDLKSRLDRAVFVLAQEREGSVSMVVSVSKSLCDTIRAPELLRAIGDAVGVKGGGRPDLARAGGGDNPAGLDAAFELAAAYVAERLV
jgi:alanyl-tRNA synthetase